MKSALLRISTAALVVVGAGASQACASTHQWGRSYPYAYERQRGLERQAFQTGLRDGYDRGLEDVRHHRRPDINRQKWFRNGDHDYDRRYGSRDQYRIEYRRGFEQGYDRAYREGYREGWRR